MDEILTNTLRAFFSDFGSIIFPIIGAILGLLASLIGLGWGVRKTIKHVGDNGFLPEKRNSFGVTESEQARIQSDVNRKMRGQF